MKEQRTTRVYKCAFCQNHGINIALKAHKRDCKYLDCQCRLCINTRLRREHMADMQYIKRNGIVELERIQNGQDADAKMKDIYAKIYKERMFSKKRDALNLDPHQALSNLHLSNRFNTISSDSLTDDQFYKAAKLLGMGFNAEQQSNLATSIINTANLFGNPASLVNERTHFRIIEESDLNGINKFIDHLNIVNCLNSDEILYRAICILFNDELLTSLDPRTTAEEIYSTFKQINVLH